MASRGSGARALGAWASAVATQVLAVWGLWNLPGPGMEPSPLHWQADSYPLHHQGSLELSVLTTLILSFFPLI